MFPSTPSGEQGKSKSSGRPSIFASLTLPLYAVSSNGQLLVRKECGMVGGQLSLPLFLPSFLSPKEGLISAYSDVPFFPLSLSLNTDFRSCCSPVDGSSASFVIPMNFLFPIQWSGRADSPTGRDCCSQFNRPFLHIYRHFSPSFCRAVTLNLSIVPRSLTLRNFRSRSISL